MKLKNKGNTSVRDNCRRTFTKVQYINVEDKKCNWRGLSCFGTEPGAGLSQVQD
jgi:hypothetical protein